MLQNDEQLERPDELHTIKKQSSTSSQHSNCLKHAYIVVLNDVCYIYIYVSCM